MIKKLLNYILITRYVILIGLLSFTLIFFNINLSAQKLSAQKFIIEKIVDEIVFVYIPSGAFVMGKNSKGEDYSPQHKVTISNGFWIGKYEITQKQYFNITGENPCDESKYGTGDNLPVYNISWYDATMFCNKLSKTNNLEPYYIINTNQDKDNISKFDDIKWSVQVNEKANGFRLPTEAEWEYVYRSGTKTKYYWGDDSSYDMAGRYSWHLFNSGLTGYYKGKFKWVKQHKMHEVGSKKPNNFGLYDMNGNVSEWCFDRYNKDSYSKENIIDPIGYQDKYMYRVVRGGSILDSPDDFTSYKRWPVEAFERTGVNGLRVVLPE
ncbi:MAG: formylglycine-generating enzyme family protein [Leptospirales bacterium]|nr:formylglycine-generating enzyme family protein [Leptospirales bacterium]